MVFHTLQEDYKNLIVLIFFISLFTLGFNIYDHYGISFDEQVSRDNGGVSLKYILDLINENISLNDIELKKYTILLNEYRDKDYGVFFDMSIFIIERIFAINDSRNQYLLRHFSTFIFYFLGTIYLYKIIEIIYGWKWGLLGILIYISCPRIFAESFYNNKDIVFMTACIFCTYTLLKFINNINYRNAFTHSLITAMAIDIRIAGLMFPILTLSIVMLKVFIENERMRTICITLFYLLTAFIFMVLFWPWLWEDPVNRFLIAFKNMSNFRWDNYNFYMGNYVSAKNLPWHYLPVWISITLPTLYLLFALIGSGRTLYLILKLNINDAFKKIYIVNIISLGILACPIGISILLNSTIYDGWRQFYFVFPSFVILCISGIHFIYNIYEYRFYRISIISLIIIQVFSLAIWSIKNHPYQNVYFNFLASKKWNTQYDADYWGLTNFNGIKNILKFDDRPIIKISSIGATSINQSISFLSENDKKRIIYSNIIDADYIITNYRFFDGSPMLNLNNNWFVFEEIKVDNNIIFTSFKKNNYP